jgi:hypothetical protein
MKIPTHHVSFLSFEGQVLTFSIGRERPPGFLKRNPLEFLPVFKEPDVIFPGINIAGKIMDEFDKGYPNAKPNEAPGEKRKRWRIPKAA